MDDEKLLMLQNNIVEAVSDRVAKKVTDDVTERVTKTVTENVTKAVTKKLEETMQKTQEANDKRFDKLEKEMKATRKEVRKLVKTQDEDFGVLENMIVEVDKKHDRQFQIVIDLINDTNSKITDTQNNVAILLNGTKEILRNETKDVENKLRKEIADVKKAI